MNRKYFYSFTQSERRGFVVLWVLLLILIVILLLKPHWQPADDKYLSAFADSIAVAEIGENVSHSHMPDTTPNRRYKPRRLKPFAFDPNTLAKEGWVAMGFTEKQAQAVVNYRKKGGQFRKKADVKKIFFVGEEEYKQLEPYIEIPQHETTRAMPLPTPKKKFEIELNTADTLDLQQVYGIGPVFSKRILKYRALLGGYYAKEQLMEVYGFSTELYEKLTPYIVVDTSKVSKIDINTADIYELKKHPYLDYYQAKAIVQYRLSNGAFSTINDILHVPIIDVATFEKIKPYLSVQ